MTDLELPRIAVLTALCAVGGWISVRTLHIGATALVRGSATGRWGWGVAWVPTHLALTGAALASALTVWPAAPVLVGGTGGYVAALLWFGARRMEVA